jgi:hypothetical protein
MICMNRDRRSFLVSSVAAPFVQTRKRTVERPNVVLFMTDDHGAREIRTPNIDRLPATHRVEERGAGWSSELFDLEADPAESHGPGK